jgi:hypothetical protein
MSLRLSPAFALVASSVIACSVAAGGAIRIALFAVGI